jgi:glutathione synthase/RimK-type ligase-like ATP-grasp enzyme
MKTIYIRGGKGSNTAIRVVTHHLEKLGHTVTRSKEDPFEVGVSWGCSYNGDKPFLNARVNQYDKLTAFDQFRKAGVACPETFSVERGMHHAYPDPLPWLARKRHHIKGKDIVVCKTQADIRRVFEQGEHDFFSVFIPTATEYRVWVLGEKAFAVYEKTYKGEGEYDGFMRNRRFGFKFEKRDELRGTKVIEGPCIAAVKSLGMDWGAVDILKGKDGKYYVLEINSMPHIDSIERSSGIRLAQHISKWAEKQ